GGAGVVEARQAREVPGDGKPYLLKRPFRLLATQNPLEHDGTYPLPEAQVDRFMFKLLVDYPPLAQEAEILRHYAEGRDPRQLAGFDIKPVLTLAETAEVQQAVLRVIVEKKVTDYVA